MKAVAVFPGEKSVRVVNDHPEPKLQRPSEVLLQMLQVGVCGTDREIARFDYGTPPPGERYLVLGHESLGRVLEVGSGVSHIKKGDLVVTMVRRPCDRPDCPACAIGRPDFCLTGQFTERGISGRHGFMTERVVDDERYMIVLSPALDQVGVLLEPLTIAEKALIEIGDIEDRLPWLRPGAKARTGDVVKRAVVLGAGPVGLLGAMALLIRGYQTWVYSREPGDSENARWVDSVGARYVSSTDVPIPNLQDVVGNIDLVYEATGNANVAFQALQSLGTNGVFIFTGVPGRTGKTELDAELIMRNLVLKNQMVYGTVNAGRDAFETAAADLSEFQRRWPNALPALITGKFRPEDCEALLVEKSTGIKRVVTFSDAP